MNFYSIKIRLGLFYAERFGNHVYCIVMFTFVHLFMCFLQTLISNTNNLKTDLLDSESE